MPEAHSEPQLYVSRYVYPAGEQQPIVWGCLLDGVALALKARCIGTLKLLLLLCLGLLVL